MAVPIKTTLINAATASGTFKWAPDFGALVTASLQVEWTGNPARVCITVKALLGGTTFDNLVVIDSNEGDYSGKIVTLQLPVGIEVIRSELELVGSSEVSLYLRGQN